MVMRYSQVPGARPIHWVKAGEVRGCDKTIAVANAVAQAQAKRVGRLQVSKALAESSCHPDRLDRVLVREHVRDDSNDVVERTVCMQKQQAGGPAPSKRQLCRPA
jgi:hypothetical protein